MGSFSHTKIDIEKNQLHRAYSEIKEQTLADESLFSYQKYRRRSCVRERTDVRMKMSLDIADFAEGDVEEDTNWSSQRP